MSESTYQAGLIGRLRKRFPGCIILKNDSGYCQGIPDLTIFWRTKWATLEVKADEDSPEQPNQRYYVELMDSMSFSAFIFPQNEEEVLNALERSFSPKRKARVLQS